MSSIQFENASLQNKAHLFAVGQYVWVPDDADAWLVAAVSYLDSNRLEVKFVEKSTNYSPGMLKILHQDKHPDYYRVEAAGNHLLADVSNLVDLDELSEGSILHHIRKRYFCREIYTHVGSILVAVNPFQKLDIYGSKDIKRASSASAPYPHIFVTAAIAYQQLRTNQRDQSVLIRFPPSCSSANLTDRIVFLQW
jgi:myosin-5